MGAPIHLQPTAPLAPRVLLPGDPGRALLFAQVLLDEPRMFNHHRGLWGYTGPAKADGEALTIQSTGMGGPSAAIVVAELIELGAQRLVRTGTCGALAAGRELGEVLVVTEALAADGTSRALGAGERVAPDPGLTARLAGDGNAVAVTTDLFYDPDVDRQERWVAAGAAVVEMECAAVFAAAAARGCAAAGVLLVTDIVLPARERIGHEALRAGEERLGQVAVAALAG
jgi:uridine phosphorylase